MKADEYQYWRLQAKVEDLEAAVGALQADGDSPSGTATILGQTFTETTYPVSASRVYAIHPASPGGDEEENAVGSVTAGTGTIYAANLGSAVPPSGSNVVCFAIGSRWAFRYD